MNRESNSRRQKEKPQQTIKRKNTKKEKEKRASCWGGGVTFLWAKHSHETEGTCPGVLRVGEKRVRREMKLVG